ncbi:MAG: biopolymer transporter ExbD [Planctomycetaceae bacterium]|nr:biopolymer transporter ExbD [Planctomycetaceae bacterium]
MNDLENSESEEQDSPKPRRKLADDEVDITPMIDCVFLLLIFFMVTSTMKASADLDLPVAHYGTGVPAGNATIVTIRRMEAGGPPTILLGDGRGPETDLAGLRTHVEESMQRTKRHVIIKAERDIPHGFVQEVTRVVNDVEGTIFNIGVQEKK